MNSYLAMLQDSLQKKITILDKVIAHGNEQQALLKQEPFDPEAFDKTMDEKERLAEEIEKLDDGFEKVYDRIREDVLTNKEKYADQIKVLQALIAQVTEKSVTVQAMETRIRMALDNQMKKQRKDLQQKRSSGRAARSYYESMSRINYVDAQFMDKKK